MTRNLGNEISDHRIFLESLKKDVDSINVKVNDFFRRLEEFCKRSDLPSEFIEHRAVTEGRLNGLTSKIQEGTVNLKFLSSEHQKIQNQVANLQTSVDSAHAILLSFKETALRAEQNLWHEVQNLKADVDNRILAHRDTIKQAMDAFRSEVGASPASIVATNMQIAKSLDEATKGLRNALEKTRGIDDHLTRLEDRVKKLEGQR